MADNVLWQIIEAANTLFETFVTYWVFKDLLGKNRLIKKYQNFIGFFALFASSTILYAVNPNPTLTLIFTIVSTFLYSLLFKGSVKYKSFISILLISLESLSELFAMYAIMFFAKITAQFALQDGPFRLVGIVTSDIIFLVLSRVLSMAKNRKRFDIPTLYWIVLLIIPALSIIMMNTVFVYISMVKTISFRVLSYISDVSILFINFTILYLFNKLIEDFNMKTHYKLLEQQIGYQSSHYKDLEASSRKIRVLRHDIKNHLQCLNELIASGNIYEAQNYIKSVADVLTVKSCVIATGNSALDSILNAKIMFINEKHINFNYTIEIPNKIKMEPVDVCVLFGNSLDNAIEACDRIANGTKNISMIISYRNNSLIYSLSNSTNGHLVKSGRFFKTSKNNYGEHGLGLSNIERTVEKYNGVLNVQHEDNMFKLSSVLYNV